METDILKEHSIRINIALEQIRHLKNFNEGYRLEILTRIERDIEDNLK